MWSEHNMKPHELNSFDRGSASRRVFPTLPDRGRLPSAHGADSPPGARPARSAAAITPPRAKAVICLFQHGGPSQMDLFDPKPQLNKYHGQPYPAGDLETHFDKQKGNVPPSVRRHGGSAWSLRTAAAHGPHADDLTLIADEHRASTTSRPCG
jgi:hypothetical protein